MSKNYTEEQVKEYIENAGYRCPVCKSVNLSWGLLMWTASGSQGEVACGDCGEHWYEVMRRVEIITP